MQSTNITAENLVSLYDLCRELSISVATGRNWIKLGKITPVSTSGQTPYFDREYMIKLKSDIQSGQIVSLKSRRNKKYISGNNIYHSYVSDDSVNLPVVQSILDFIEKNGIEITDGRLCAVIAECALQLTLNRQSRKKTPQCLAAYINGELPDSQYLFLIDDFIRPYSSIKYIIASCPELFDFEFTYEEKEDVLGLLYISLQNIGNRKATGSYYTPTRVVQKLCRQLFSMNDPAGKDILDPCCGTGNFFLQFPSSIDFHHVYGNDIDSVSVKIARINYALKYGVTDASILYTHITESDYLSFSQTKKYDFILGNPPWGYHFTDSRKKELKLKYDSASGSNVESYDVFMEQALLNLKKGGILSFVLPEAILNVKTHTPIRRLLIERCSIQYLEYLGNVFDKVQCPCIILQSAFTEKRFYGVGMLINDGTRTYSIQKERSLNAECLSFFTTDEENRIIEKIEKLHCSTTLKGKSKFALGIVTGDNKKYVSQKKDSENELVLKGSDLLKFRFMPSQNYIAFQPDSFQQVAPVEYYRAPEKLLYRFICNQLVFAYDNHQTLSLNSCNILIPESENLDIKYIMAILNSRVAQFYFKKQFRSVKILRSHIERIPIPAIEKKAQDSIIKVVDSILEASDSSIISNLYEILDNEISVLYELSEEETKLIRKTLEGENLFLY